MGKYKIKVKVEIVETDDLEVGSLKKGKDSSFEININEVAEQKNNFLSAQPFFIVTGQSKVPLIF